MMASWKDKVIATLGIATASLILLGSAPPENSRNNHDPNQPERVVHDDGSWVEYTYDASGCVVREQYSDGRVANHRCDDSGD